jgi:hypothetical protein
MKKLNLVLILIILVMGISYIIINESTNNKVLNIAESSIKNKYQVNEEEIKNIYTHEYLEKINNEKGTAKYNGNYKILDINILEKDLIKGKYWVNVQIEDSMGRYVQHIYIIRENNRYRIYDIENDI